MADCSYTVPDLDASGDVLYGRRICNQPFIDYAWLGHGFNNDYWQDGWGFDDPCNIRKPLARTLNAIWLLGYSAEDYQNEEWNGPILNWAPRYVRQQLSDYDDLRASCGNSPIARTSGCQQTRQWNEWRCTNGYNETKRECRTWFFLFAWICHLYALVKRWVCTLWGWVSTAGCVIWYGTFGGGENITLFLPFFYPLDDASGNKNVVERACTLVHEARHAGSKPHDAQFPAGSIYGAGSDGADSSWGLEGAWMYNALYAWWFYAAGTRTSLDMKTAAKDEANVVLLNCFATSPGIVVA